MHVLIDTHEGYVQSVKEERRKKATFGILLTCYDLAAPAGRYYFGRPRAGNGLSRSPLFEIHFW